MSLLDTRQTSSPQTVASKRSSIGDKKKNPNISVSLKLRFSNLYMNLAFWDSFGMSFYRNDNFFFLSLSYLLGFLFLLFLVTMNIVYKALVYGLFRVSGCRHEASKI